MTQKYQLFVLPSWLMKIADHAQVSAIELLEYEKIKHILSPEDLTHWLAMQSSNLGGLNFGELGANPYNLVDSWAASYPTYDRDYITKALNAYYGSVNASAVALQRLDSLASAEDYEKKFRVIDMRYGRVGLVLYPGLFAENKTVSVTDTFALIEEIIKVLYAYLPTQTVAQNNIFVKYLKLMEEHRAVT